MPRGKAKPKTFTVKVHYNTDMLVECFKKEMYFFRGFHGWTVMTKEEAIKLAKGILEIYE